MSCLFIVLFCLLIVVYNIVQWGQCFPHSAQWGKCFPHCAEWGKHFPHSRIFFEKCSESSDSSRKLKISKSIFSIQNRSKHLKKFSKMDFFKKSSKFFEKCSESSDSSRKLKISKSIFSHTTWVKTLVKIFKNRIFQKMFRIFWFIWKIEKLKINFYQYKMGQNTLKIFQKSNFSKKS